MWSSANISASCQVNPSLPSCQPAMLAFMAFIVQNFGHSHDDAYSDINNGNNNSNEEFDFIIVGGGTAGCVVANRLSEINHWKILLLEAGGEAPVISNVPGLYRSLSGSSIDWKYQSEPEPYACGGSKDNRCYIPRGKVMGGSSSINGMAYVRGNREDYDEWARLGNEGWSYQDVLPYFLKSEDNRDKHFISKDRARHSTGGPLSVSPFPYVDKNNRVIIDAWKELGLQEVDYNGQNQVGVNFYQSILVHGARQSTNGAFIRPIRGKRSNLVIKTNAVATKITMYQKTRHAQCVEYSVSGDKINLRRACASKEIIVSAGVFESPKLLMLSGIGHRAELEKIGIKVIRDLPVGDNLQDHIMFSASVGILDKNMSTVVSTDEMKNDALYWLNSHEGPLGGIGSIPSTMTFLQTPYENRSGVPDLQIYHFQSLIKDVEILKSYDGFGSTYLPVSYYDALTITPVLLSPKSRGTVRLNADSPTWSHPKIKLNYFEHPDDLKVLAKGAKMTKRLFDTATFKKQGIKKYQKPVENCKKYKFESGKYFRCVARKYSFSGLHLTGTCKMGNDSTAVVDSKLRVRGVGGLRVMDASVMPNVPRGNTMAATIMIAEKGSDFIKNAWL